MKRETVLAYAAFAIVCVVWGTTYLAIRVAVTTMTPFLLTGARYLVAGVILFVVAKLSGNSVPRDRVTLRNLVLCGFLLVGIGNLAVVWAEQWVPSGFAALFVGTAPLWATLIELTRAAGDRIDVRRFAGMLIGFFGVALLVTPRGAGNAFDAHFVIGALVIQVGCFAWQYGTVHGKATLGRVPPLMSSALQMLAGGLIVTVIGFAIGEAPRFHTTPKTLLALAYLSLFGSVIAFTSYIYAATKLRITTMSLYAYVNPVVAVILGWLVLHEQLTVVSVIAIAIILGGVALVQSGRMRRRSPATIPGTKIVTGA
jgi:drug/metabolite transporter (DMT)-like permease